LVSRLKKGNTFPAGTVYKVKNWNNKGEIELESNVKVSDIEDLKKENGIPEFYSYIGKPPKRDRTNNVVEDRT
jgi:hypothetical protein